MPWSDWTGDICAACFVWLVGRHHCAYTLYIGVKGGFSRLWGEGKIGIFFVVVPFLMGCGGIVLSLCPK